MPARNFFRRLARSLREASRRARNARLVDTRELYRYWEEEQLRKVFAAYRPDCVFDVGANYGQYATMLRQRVGYKGLIISFEPAPAAVEVLRKKAQGDACWLVSDHAISTCNGKQTFNLMTDSEFSSLSEPDHSQTSLFKSKNAVSTTISVTTETLATALDRLRNEHGFSRPFLKLDTQGWDASIVAASPGAMPAFIGLQSELSVKKLYAHAMDFRGALSLYESCGFTLSSFVPNNAGHFPVLVETDCIMVNNRLLSGD